MKRETGHRWAVLCAAMVTMAWGAVEAASLPPGYTELAWIQSTGTQYIDTGVTAVVLPLRFFGRIDMMIPSSALTAAVGEPNCVSLVAFDTAGRPISRNYALVWSRPGEGGVIFLR